MNNQNGCTYLPFQKGLLNVQLVVLFGPKFTYSILKIELVSNAKKSYS